MNPINSPIEKCARWYVIIRDNKNGMKIRYTPHRLVSWFFFLLLLFICVLNAISKYYLVLSPNEVSAGMKKKTTRAQANYIGFVHIEIGSTAFLSGCVAFFFLIKALMRDDHL